jgi:hypothetical protein
VWLAGAVRPGGPRRARYGAGPSTLKGRCAIAARRPAARPWTAETSAGPCQAKDTGRPGGLPAGRAALSIYSPTPSPGSGPYKATRR